MIEELKKTFKSFNKQFKKWPDYSREDNFKRFVELEFPNKRLEDWKFLDFDSIFSKKFKKLKIDLDNKNKFDFNEYIKDFDHNKITFLNGVFNKSNFENENKQKIICNSVKGFDEHMRTTIDDKSENSLNFLNNAFYLDGVHLTIEKGYQLEKPIVIYNVFNSMDKSNFFNQKIKVRTGENTKVDIFMYTINLGSEPIFLNVHNDFLVSKNSFIKIYNFNELKDNDFFYNFNDVDVMNSAIFENFTMSCSSHLFKHEIKCNLKEKYASGFINGAFLNKNQQNNEIKTRIEHRDENTKSFQKIKSVLDKNSKAVFQGKIYVDSKAQHTDGYQLSKSIILDKESEFDSKPELEIYADDVKCSHGSTSGNLDEDSIFYLMSRGLSRQEAKKLLIQGFLVDAVETITNKEIKEYFLEKLKKQINEFK